jgi:hypothetical protein
VTRRLFLAITRVPGETVGTYQVTPNGLSNPNYLISFVSGTLTITGTSAPTVLTISVLNGTDFLLSWNAVSNTAYRVQFKSDLNAPIWTDLAGDVTANSGTASKTDPVTAANRFYRIRVLP